MKLLRVLSITVVMLMLVATGTVYANTFASHIRATQEGSNGGFDGSFTDGTGLAIRFDLSDHADSVIILIKEGATTVRTLKATDLPLGDAAVVWDGKDENGVDATLGDHSYSVWVSTYDQGHSSFTVLSDVDHNIYTRGVTSITNPNLKNFGFIYTADGGGYNGNGMAVMRHTADGAEWGDVMGNAHLTTTGEPISGTLRYSSEADSEGYVYLLNRSSSLPEVFRYHTDTLNIALVDSGGYSTTNNSALLQGLAVRGTGAARYLAIAAYSKVYGFHLGNASTYFGTKDVILEGDSTFTFWDVTFGRDSMMYVTYHNNKDTGAVLTGVAEFNLTGYSGTALTMADTVWTAMVDTPGYTTQLKYYKGMGDLSTDMIYFVMYGAGSPRTGVYAMTDIGGARTITQAWEDGSGGNSAFRADVTADVVGNVIHFENSTEDVVIVSPPTGANNYTTPGSFTLKLVNSVPIADVVADNNNDFVPDSLGKTVTVIGTVNGPNLGGYYTSYSIQDENAAILIYNSTLSTYKVGDRVVVTGEIKQNKGTTEIAPTSVNDIILLDSGNTVTPVTLTLQQYLANPEMYENRLITITGLTKTASSVGWPAAGKTSSMWFWDGWDSVNVYIDKDGFVDGSAEPTYPVNITGVGGQYTSSTPPNDGYELMPGDSTQFESGVAVPPNPHFMLTAPADSARIVLNDSAQTVSFMWNTAIDLNGDALIYQWVPVGKSAVTTANKGADNFIDMTAYDLVKKYLGTADSLMLKWTVYTKGAEATIVHSVDTMSVMLVKNFVITGVNSYNDGLPTTYSLSQNFPNPFNPTTSIRYGIPNDGTVSLKIYNTLGQEVATLVNQYQARGFYTVPFNASRLASGMYIYRLQSGSYTSVKKMMLLK
jgi:hypothetical protein